MLNEAKNQPELHQSGPRPHIAPVETGASPESAEDTARRLAGERLSQVDPLLYAALSANDPRLHADFVLTAVMQAADTATAIREATTLGDFGQTDGGDLASALSGVEHVLTRAQRVQEIAAQELLATREGGGDA